MSDVEKHYAQEQGTVGDQQPDLERLADQAYIRDLEAELDRKNKELIIQQELILTLQKGRDEAEMLAETDTRTGIDNRRGFERKDVAFFRIFARELQERERRTESGVTYNRMFIDIDHFKNFNTVYGYQAADEVLKSVAQLLRQTMRPRDLVGRWGGEEFVIGFMLSKDEDGESRSIIAERVRRAVEQATFEYEGVSMKVTVSIGMSQVRPGDTYATFDQRASDANKRAKERGRNRVVIAELDDELSAQQP